MRRELGPRHFVAQRKTLPLRYTSIRMVPKRYHWSLGLVVDQSGWRAARQSAMEEGNLRRARARFGNGRSSLEGVGRQEELIIRRTNGSILGNVKDRTKEGARLGVAPNSVTEYYYLRRMKRSNTGTTEYDARTHSLEGVSLGTSTGNIYVGNNGARS